MSDNVTKLRPVHGWLLVLSLALFAALRAGWIGHPLSWDEAMALLSVRAFAAHGHDYFSDWFWRRPPILGILMLLIRPLTPGLAERAEALALLIGVAAFVALFALNRRTLGATTALWAGFFLAVMPGARFYDVWVKQDVVATVFGLVAVNLFVREKYVLSGLLLGFGLLGKELAVFFGAAIFVLWVLRPRASRRLPALLAVALPALAVSVWWYVLFSNSVKQVLKFAFDAQGKETTIWSRPWYYFFDKLHVDIGFWGVGLCLLGVFALWMLRRRSPSGSAESPDSVEQGWPLALLLPAYVVISLLRGKTPWFTTTLYPALATLQGIGAAWVVAAAERRAARLGRTVGVSLTVLLLGIVLVAGVPWGGDYEDAFRAQDESLWHGSTVSRSTAFMMNRLVKDSERALITPMYYWMSREPNPCPVFTYYLKDMPVLVRPTDTPLEQLLALIRQYRLDWMMFSPDPEIGFPAVIEPMMKRYKTPVILLEGASILNVSGIHQQSAAPPGLQP
jgi:4-amino-4-deoxy-L-arabinose transferase-like glycosyltransferase